MKTPNDGGPAFPQGIDQGTSSAGFPIVTSEGGMTLRDWFAGQALAGLLGDHLNLATVKIDALQKDKGSPFESMAQWAYEHADAMIEARSTPRT